MTALWLSYLKDNVERGGLGSTDSHQLLNRRWLMVGIND